MDFEDKGGKLSTFIRTEVSSSTFATRSQRAGNADPTLQPIWMTILNRTEAIKFGNFIEFIDCVLCPKTGKDCGKTSISDFDNLQKSDIHVRDQSAQRPTHSPDPCSADNCEDIQCRQSLKDERDSLSRVPHFRGVDSYDTLKKLTEIFLLLECGFGIPTSNNTLLTDDDIRKYNDTGFEATGITTWGGVATELGKLLSNSDHSYLLTILENLHGVGWKSKATNRPWCNEVFMPMSKDGKTPHPGCSICPIELIWSYWHEEGMLVQSINAISRRFQNLRGPLTNDPLAELELAPLWSLNNLLWGYLQDEQNRLSVARRNFEYDHHYGIKLLGRAVPGNPSADSRSKFLNAFHGLLNTCVQFYAQDANTQVIAEGFPVLNALRECHLELAQGAHNQFRDLPWTSRVEMLIQQWLLARSEMQSFLRGRPMVPYREGWMGQVDSMKKLQGWTDTSVMHFNDLAVYGERLLLSIRYTNWTNQNYDENDARAWARFWKQEVQGYIHGYRTATGIDLGTDPALRPVNDVVPSRLLMAQLQQQKQRIAS
jgi:hypothetical protein